VEARSDEPGAPGSGGVSAARSEQIRLALLVIWFVFIVSTVLWVPIYRGTGNGEMLVFVYVPLGLCAGFWVRERAATSADAIVSALPSILFVALSGIAGGLQNDANNGRFGEPLYVYFGVALLASWATLVRATAIGSRTRWNRIGGLLLGLVVAVLGWGLMTLQVN
jgi:hypothetical protein